MASLPGTARYYDIKWYDMLNDSAVALVDSGLVLKSLTAGHTYVADAYIDSNTVLNWRITSLPFLYPLSTGVNDAVAPKPLTIMPNPTTERFHIINTGEQVICRIYNELGMFVNEIAVKSGDNVYDAPEASGVYMIRTAETGELVRLVKY
jgi:hypothetical protein